MVPCHSKWIIFRKCLPIYFDKLYSLYLFSTVLIHLFFFIFLIPNLHVLQKNHNI